jgi:hypothetical protein
MGNFFTDVIQHDPRYRSVDPVKDGTLLEPGFREKVARVVASARDRGIELVPVETFRSRERQQHLFDQGKTKLRKVGTHHYGLAVDFAKLIGGRLSWDGDWTFMAELAAQHGAVSGVDWGQPDQPHSFVDAGHLQGCSLAQQDALFAGAWYPGGDSIGIAAPTPPPPSPAQPAALIIPQGLTSAQRAALTVADEINARSFSGWFLRSSMMAFMDVESSFNPDAIRHEPSGVASYGLMQVLDTTAAWLGLRGEPEQMFEPAIGIFYGLKYAAHGWNYLLDHLQRQPTLVEWCEGYNIGYGAVAQGRSRPAYSNKWMAKRAEWAALID